MPFSLPKLFPSAPLQHHSTTTTNPNSNANLEPNPNALSDSSSSSRSLSSCSSSSSPATATMSDDSASVLTFPSLPSLQCLLPSSTSPVSTSFRHLTSLKPLSTASVTSPPALTISQSSLLLYTATPTNLAMYDLTSLDLVSTHPLAPSAGAVKSLIILSKSHDLLSAHQDTLLRLWRHSSRSGDLRLSGSLPTLSDRLLRLPFPKNYAVIRRHH